MVRNLPAMQETQVRSLGHEDPLEKGMATHASILAWRIPWTEKPGRLQSRGSKASDNSMKTQGSQINILKINIKNIKQIFFEREHILKTYINKNKNTYLDPTPRDSRITCLGHG